MGDPTINQSVIFTFDFSRKYAVIDAVFKVFDRSYSMKVEVEKIKGSVAFFILEMVIIFATVTAVVLGAIEFYQARGDREAEGIARNWAILTTPAPGNSGKKQAIEYLVSRGEPLQNIDLSCARWGGEKTRKDKDGKDETYCDRGTYLVGLSIGDMGAILNGANLYQANLSWADLTSANLTWADLSGANLSGAELMSVSMNGTNLSGADFTDAEITQSYSQEAWAWSDEPPTGLPGSMMRKIVFCIFDVSKHERWNHPEVCTAP